METERQNLKRKAVTGVKWAFVGSLAERAIRFGTMVVLARLLMPAEFGLFVLGLALAGALSYIKSLGFDAALIHRDDAFDPRVSNTAFVMLSLAGLVLFGAFYLASPLIAGLMNQPEATPILRVLGISVPISSVCRVSQSLTEKKLRFKHIALAEIVGRIAFSTLAIVMALLGWGVWSLVSGYLVRITLKGAIVWIASGWTPGLQFDRRVAGEMLGYGKFIVGSSLLRYLQSNLDKIVIGRWAGPAAVGLYALGFNIANIVNVQMVRPLRQVLFPTYSRIQNDLGAMKRAFLKSIKYVFLVGAPVCVGLLILAPEVITVVYGPRWAAAATAMQILAVYGLFRSLSDSAIPVLRAMGKPSVDLRLSLTQVVIMGLFLVPAVQAWQIAGVAVVLVFAGLVVMSYMIHRMRGLLGMRTREFVAAILPGCLSAGIMGLLLLGLKLGAGRLGVPYGAWQLLAGIVTAGLTYLGSLWILERKEMLALKTLLFSRMSSDSTG